MLTTIATRLCLQKLKQVHGPPVVAESHRPFLVCLVYSVLCPAAYP
jgi:hypothetical protein